MESNVQYKAEIKDGKPVLYRRTNSEGDWDDITDTRHQVDQLEFYDYDLNLTKLSQCTTQLNGFLFTIFLNIICLHIKLGDKLIWNYYASKVRASPLQLLFNLKTNTMSLLLREKGVIKLNLKGYVNNWVRPGKPLEKFRTERIIKDGTRIIYLIGEDEKCNEIIARGHTLENNQPNSTHTIAYITDTKTGVKESIIKYY